MFTCDCVNHRSVATVGYSKGECTVTIHLISESRSRIEVKRELRPGTNLSRQTIRDENGNVIAEKDVLPELARIGHQEGTQVIFAAQHAGGRQAQVDITNFTRVLCFYLRLEKVPDLIEKLEKLLDDREEEFKSAAQEVEVAAGRTRAELELTNTKIEEILRNPPWGELPAPSKTESERKITALLDDAANSRGINGPDKSGTPLDALAHLKRELDRVGAQKHGDLDAEHKRLSGQAMAAEKALTGLLESQANLSSARADVEQAERQQLAALDGETYDAICTRVEKLERGMTENAAKADLVSRAKTLCAEYSWLQCPVCGAEHPAQLLEPLEERIATNAASLANVAPSSATLESLRSQVQKLRSIDATLSTKRRILSIASTAVSLAREQLAATMPSATVDGDGSEVRARIDDLRRATTALSGEMANSQGEHAIWSKRVKDLEQEITYHAYRGKKESLQRKLIEGLAGPREALRRYQELQRSASRIKTILEQAFDEALERARPPLEEMLTEVYQRLTRQPSYDLVRIFTPPDQQRRRELRVASSQLHGEPFPPSVLNGQAAKALRLVPYFVFSRFQPEIMELELLLIDDPSESFDTSHVGDLVGELARAAEHAQLFVATHEREKFEQHLLEHFGAEHPLELSVEGFSTMGGPKIVRR